MATNTPVLLKRFNGTDYDKLQPETTWTQVTDKPTTFTPTSHTHGDITDGGLITTSTVTAASGDAILITDVSNSNKIQKSSIVVGTGTTTFLRNDGTWATPNGDPNAYVYLATSTARQNTTYTTFLTTGTLDANSYYEVEFNVRYYKTATAANQYPIYGIIFNNLTGTPTILGNAIVGLSTNITGTAIYLASTTAQAGCTITNPYITTLAYSRFWSANTIVYTGTSTKIISLQDRSQNTITGGEFVGSGAGSFIKVRKIM